MTPLLLVKVPTAQALLKPGIRATPESELSCEPTLGPDTTFQLVPFHCSVSVYSPEFEITNPTAQTSLAETMATPLRRLFPMRFGLGTTLHCVPFQCSISVCLTPLALMKSPTAQTSVAEKLATPLRSLTDPGLGLEMTLQATACATAGARNRAISSAATTHKNRLTFKRFMMFLTNSCSLENRSLSRRPTNAVMAVPFPPAGMTVSPRNDPLLPFQQGDR